MYAQRSLFIYYTQHVLKEIVNLGHKRVDGTLKVPEWNTSAFMFPGSKLLSYYVDFIAIRQTTFWKVKKMGTDTYPTKIECYWLRLKRIFLFYLFMFFFFLPATAAIICGFLSAFWVIFSTNQPNIEYTQGPTWQVEGWSNTERRWAHKFKK